MEAWDLMETLGVNDRAHLLVAESQQDISFAESLYDLLDAVLEQEGSIDALLGLQRPQNESG